MSKALNLALYALAGGMAISACSVSDHQTEPHKTEVVTVTHSASVPATTSAPETTSKSNGLAHLDNVIDEVVSNYGGNAAVAVSDGVSTVSAGDAGAPVAWSTIKVPIAVAALRLDPSLVYLVDSAVSASDNTAAEQLWRELGDSSQAAMLTEEVLYEGGSPLAVNQVQSRSGFTSFGQTAWSVPEQARFAANLPCVLGAEGVLSAMSNVVAEQQYGLGQFPNARFKGGWGPEPDGMYTVRQFGLVPTTAGEVAVSLWVTPASGSYSDAQSMADFVVAGLHPETGELPIASCS